MNKEFKSGNYCLDGQRKRDILIEEERSDRTILSINPYLPDSTQEELRIIILQVPQLLEMYDLVNDLINEGYYDDFGKSGTYRLLDVVDKVTANLRKMCNEIQCD